MIMKKILALLLPLALAATAHAIVESEAALPDSQIGDIRVAPLTATKWGQTCNSVWQDFDFDYPGYAYKCYNRFTPSYTRDLGGDQHAGQQDNYKCGCVATAMAQLIRYNRYPAKARDVTLPCSKGSGGSKVSGDYSTSGVTYNYDLMKEVPEADDELGYYMRWDCTDYWLKSTDYWFDDAQDLYDSWYANGATEQECDMIGRLTYDCGVAMRMAWGNSVNLASGTYESEAYGAFMHDALTNVFSYANAHTYIANTNLYPDGSIPMNYLLERIILPNLDAGYPVIFGVNNNAPISFDNLAGASHVVVADGYGYTNGELRIHLNMGWNGADNGWYKLPAIQGRFEDGFRTTNIIFAVYNAFPTNTGEILSGRVLDSNGNPQAGMDVEALDPDGRIVSKVQTNAKGIYAFIIPGGVTYSLRAREGRKVWYKSGTVSLGVSRSPTSVDFSNGRYEGWMYLASGNSWGNIIVLDGAGSKIAHSMLHIR